MTIQTIEAYAAQALSYSQEMYLMAREKDWDGLARLEVKRTSILDSLFNHPSMPSLLINIADVLQRIIDIDQKTMALGKNARKSLENEMELFKQGKRMRAVDAYRGNMASQRTT